MQKNFLVAAVLFSFIFIVYSISAVGLYNSNDAPQYFTGEALVQKGTIDMSSFSQDKHFFVYPDVTTIHGRFVGMRGYMISLLSTPLHVVAENIAPFFNTENMPQEVLSVGYKKELALTALFPIFTVIGLGFLYVLLQEIVKTTWISVLFTLLMAFGTYAWKYGTMYARQPILLALIGACMYFVWRAHSNKNARWAIYAYSFCAALTFGLDSILFLALSLYLFYYLAAHVRHDRKVLFAGLIYGIIVVMLAYSHYYFYGSFNFTLYHAYPIFSAIPEAKRAAFILSAPLFPTLFHTLFGFGRLPPESFTHFLPYPEVATAFSASFAQQYMFYGLFSVSPFLFLSALGLKADLKKHEKPYRQFLLFSALIFAIGVVMNSKNFGFYAANSYDIRYFYPFAMFLVVPSAMGCKKLWSAITNVFAGILVTLSLFFLTIFSLFMGWLGVLNMYKSSLTGERRIWVDHTTIDSLKLNSKTDLLNATFLNRENIVIPVFICLAIWVLLWGLLRILKSQNTSLQQFHSSAK